MLAPRGLPHAKTGRNRASDVRQQDAHLASLASSGESALRLCALGVAPTISATRRLGNRRVAVRRQSASGGVAGDKIEVDGPRRCVRGSEKRAPPSAQPKPRRKTSVDGWEMTRTPSQTLKRKKYGAPDALAA